MSHSIQFLSAIDRVTEQVARKDFPAALRTFKQTGYLPVKALMKFVKQAPATLTVILVYDYKAHCMGGLDGEKVFDRSINLSVLLSLCAMRSIISYFKTKQDILRAIESFGVLTPLLLEQKIREIELGIKRSSSHEKLLASGFERVECNATVSKYSHSELSFILVVRTQPAEVKKLAVSAG